VRSDPPLTRAQEHTETAAGELREAARLYFEAGDPGALNDPADAVLEAAWAYGHAWANEMTEFRGALVDVLGPETAEPVVLVHQPSFGAAGWPTVEHADAWVEHTGPLVLCEEDPD